MNFTVKLAFLLDFVQIQLQYADQVRASSMSVACMLTVTVKCMLNVSFKGSAGSKALPDVGTLHFWCKALQLLDRQSDTNKFR